MSDIHDFHQVIFGVISCYLYIQERLETVSSSLVASLNSDGPWDRDEDIKAKRTTLFRWASKSGAKVKCFGLGHW